MQPLDPETKGPQLFYGLRYHTHVVKPVATEVEVQAALGTAIYGILSNPFLDRSSKTVGFRMRVSVNSDGTWSYEEEAMLEIPGLAERFAHRDRNTRTRIAAPTPNPMIGGSR